MPEILQWQRERLQNKLEEADIQWITTAEQGTYSIGSNVLMLQKELDRLEAHVKETRNILKKKRQLAAVLTL